MIKVHVFKSKEKIEEVEISGHAGYAKSGYDIVCSAVSSIVTTSVNGILMFAPTIKVVDDGNKLSISVLKDDSITNTLLENMLLLLKDLEKEYKKNIKIIEKGE